MVRVFCVLERIGGYSGKRIQIKRIDSLIYNEIGIREMEGCNMVKSFRLFLASKSDILKVKDEIIDLDNFMEKLQEQGTEYRKDLVSISCKIIDLIYKKGEVTSFKLIEIMDIIKEVLENYFSYDRIKDSPKKFNKFFDDLFDKTHILDLNKFLTRMRASNFLPLNLESKNVL